MASRDCQESKDAVERIKQDTGKDTIELITLDLADLHCVRRAAKEFLKYVVSCYYPLPDRFE